MVGDYTKLVAPLIDTVISTPNPGRKKGPPPRSKQEKLPAHSITASLKAKACKAHGLQIWGAGLESGKSELIVTGPCVKWGKVARL